MTIENALIEDQEGNLEAFVLIDGNWYGIDTKESLLEEGIVTLTPVSDDRQTELVVRTSFSATVPADPADGRTEEMVIENATRDPELLRLARKWHELATAGKAAAGPLIP